MANGTTPPAGGYYIFRPWRRLPDGTIDYAKDHGKKAFKIWISNDRERKKP